MGKKLFRYQVLCILSTEDNIGDEIEWSFTN